MLPSEQEDHNILFLVNISTEEPNFKQTWYSHPINHCPSSLFKDEMETFLVSVGFENNLIICMIRADKYKAILCTIYTSIGWLYHEMGYRSLSA